MPLLTKHIGGREAGRAGSYNVNRQSRIRGRRGDTMRNLGISVGEVAFEGSDMDRTIDILSLTNRLAGVRANPPQDGSKGGMEP
jgi:hypothetical protein